MATSGVYAYDLSADDIIEEAFDLIQVAADGEALSGDFSNRALRSLNLMLTDWMTQGIHLHTLTEAALWLVKSQASYDLDTANCASVYESTTTDADEAIGQTVISVTSTSGMANTDIIGIVQDDNTIHWSTIASFVADDTVTIDDGLTVAATSGNAVYHYTATAVTALPPISRILEVRRRESATSEIPIEFASREDYFDLPNKEQDGSVIQVHHARNKTNGTMYVWNRPSSEKVFLTFTYERQMQTITAGTQTLDIPRYYQSAVIWNLAKRLIPKFGCSPERKIDIEQQAERYLDEALSYDSTLYPMYVRFSHGGRD